jgi:hypothetical protein
MNMEKLVEYQPPVGPAFLPLVLVLMILLLAVPASVVIYRGRMPVPGPVVVMSTALPPPRVRNDVYANLPRKFLPLSKYPATPTRPHVAHVVPGAHVAAYWAATIKAYHNARVANALLGEGGTQYREHA